MSEKKEFLLQFKRTVKNEGGNLPAEYILQRINRGDISESDIASFKRYIPLELGATIERIMGRRRLLGILKAANEIYDDKSKLTANTAPKDIITMINNNQITQEDIQMYPDLPSNTDITRALAKQIDRFLKKILNYTRLTKEEQNKEKFKLEKLLRRKIVTFNYIQGRANIKDILVGIFGDDYKRYLTEEPYEMEIKQALDMGFIDESNAKYLPDIYVDYYIKDMPSSSGSTSFKKRKLAGSVPAFLDVISKDEMDLFQTMVLGYSVPKQPRAVVEEKIKYMSDEDLLNMLTELEQKESKKEMSGLARRLDALGFSTKSARKKITSMISKLRDKMINNRKKRLREDALMQGVTPKRGVTKSLYSIERKLEDIKRGRSNIYLSPLDKNFLAKELGNRIRKEITVKGNRMNIDSIPGSSRSSVSSRSSRSSRSSSASPRSRSSSLSSLFDMSSRSSRSSKSSRSSRSSRSSGRPSAYISSRVDKPREMPVLIQVGNSVNSQLDPNSIKVLSTFVNKSISYSGSKKNKKEQSNLVIDKASLDEFLKNERDRTESYIKKRRRSSSSMSGLSSRSSRSSRSNSASRSSKMNTTSKTIQKQARLAKKTYKPELYLKESASLSSLF